MHHSPNLAYTTPIIWHSFLVDTWHEPYPVTSMIPYPIT